MTDKKLGFWPSASLQAKFLLITVPLLLLVVTCFFAVVHVNSVKNAREALHARMVKVTEIQSAAISGLLWNFNIDQTALILRAMANDPDLVGAMVQDETGSVVAQVGMMQTTAEQLNILEKPIVFYRGNDQPPVDLGQLQIAFSEENLKLASRQRLYQALGIAALLTISSVASALMALRLTVRRPLLRLLGSIRLAREENIRQPVDWATSDEIGTIVTAYNDLQEKQESYENQLRNIRDTLEQRVVERTRELKGREIELSRAVSDLEVNQTALMQAKEAAETALSDLQNAQKRLVQAEKMASLGQLTAGIAHEIKNPLNFVNNFSAVSNEMLGELSQLLQGPIAQLDPKTRAEAEELLTSVCENLVKIESHGKRADSIIKNMLLHSREGPTEPQTVHLNTLAEQALNLAYHGARAEFPGSNITIEKSLDPALIKIECYPQAMLRVLLNLISNGIYAANQKQSASGQEFQPKLTLTTQAKGRNAIITISDNGVGISRAERDQIFLPFFTTKPAGDGTGLGLSLSYDIIVTQHGGELKVASEPGEYTCFTIEIPLKLKSDNGVKA
ncbi:Sensor protein ZraS [Roseovarius litorisediminis]|uniref:histidine kinase n=1 Tax=Roseovarius litorisediminis TaxID=1312363 RepID=A0A1Y5SPI1_9RHOB|nr:ATP-binding protein [Roseovarius litorisediminis]SLN45045.1 Sensor protein ZraS [Roseovarius litorisediminis]